MTHWGGWALNWLKRNSLWLAAIGLMLASSGLDGVYLGKLMPADWAWLGLVLNTMADVSGLILTYWYGRLQQERSVKKRRLARVLLAAEIIAVGYSWFFAWRQLLAVMPAVEAAGYRVLAPIAAGFIPLLLAFIGYAQSLSETQTHDSAPQPAPAKVEPEPAGYHCKLCSYVGATQHALNAHQRAHSNGKRKVREVER